MITLGRSNKGYPTAWESGGGRTNTGEAQIICDSKGNAKTPLIKRGHANGNHALFILNKGDMVVRGQRHRGDFRITIYRVLSFDNCEVVDSFQNGEWGNGYPSAFANAVEAAKGKMACYHCSCVHFESRHKSAV